MMGQRITGFLVLHGQDTARLGKAKGVWYLKKEIKMAVLLSTPFYG
jgi:hypothetical protein